MRRHLRLIWVSKLLTGKTTRKPATRKHKQQMITMKRLKSKGWTYKIGKVRVKNGGLTYVYCGQHVLSAAFSASLQIC